MTIRDAAAPGVEKVAETAVDVERAKEDKDKVIDTVNSVASAAATAESHTASGK